MPVSVDTFRKVGTQSRMESSKPAGQTTVVESFTNPRYWLVWPEVRVFPQREASSPSPVRPSTSRSGWAAMIGGIKSKGISRE